MIALPTLRLTAAPLDEVAAGLLLVPVFEQDALEDLAQLDAAAQGDVGRAMAVSEFRG
jgi:hypothetical protein